MMTIAFGMLFGWMLIQLFGLVLVFFAEFAKAQSNSPRIPRPPSPPLFAGTMPTWAETLAPFVPFILIIAALICATLSGGFQ